MAFDEFKSDGMGFIEALLRYGIVPLDSLRTTVERLCAMGDMGRNVLMGLGRSYCGNKSISILYSIASARCGDDGTKIFDAIEFMDLMIEKSKNSQMETMIEKDDLAVGNTDLKTSIAAAIKDVVKPLLSKTSIDMSRSETDSFRIITSPNLRKLSLDLNSPIAEVCEDGIHIDVICGAVRALAHIMRQDQINEEDHQHINLDFWAVAHAFSCALSASLSQADIILTSIINFLLITSPNTLEWDIIVTIFSKTANLIDTVLNQEFVHDAATTQTLISNLLILIQNHSDSLSLTAKYTLFQSLITHYEFLPPFISHLVMHEAPTVLEAFGLLPVQVHLLLAHIFYCPATQPTATRMQILEILHSFNFESEDKSQLAMLLISTLLTEKNDALFSKTLEWIEDYVVHFEDGLMVLIEVLLRCIMNLNVHVGNVMQFWHDDVSMHNCVKSVPIVTGAGIGNVPMSHSIAATRTLVNLFGKLAKSRSYGAVLIYSWICRVSCWISSVGPHLRIMCLEFLASFCTDRNGRILYTAPMDGGSDSVLAPGIYCSKEVKPGEGFVLPLQEYAFALITLLKFENSPHMLQQTLQVVTDHLQDENLWMSIPEQVKVIRKAVCATIISESAGSLITQLPSNFKKSDFYHSYYRILLTLIPYRSLFSKSEQDQIVSAFQFGLGRWPNSGKLCMEALTLSLYELPNSMLKQIPAIVLKISQITSLSMAIPNLEFLSSLSRHPELYINFTDIDYKRVLGIALLYLRTYVNSDTTVYSQYVTQLGYYVVAIWFLSLKVPERRKYVPFVIQHMTAQGSKLQLDEPVELVLDLVSIFLTVDGAEYILGLLA